MPQQTKQCMQQLRRVMKSGARGEQTEGVSNKAKSGRRLRRWAVKGILARNAANCDVTVLPYLNYMSDIQQLRMG